MRKLLDQFVEFRVAGPGDVAAAPVVVRVRYLVAGQANKILLRVYVRAGGVHLNIGEKADVNLLLVIHRVAAEENRGVVVDYLRLNSDLAPPALDEGLCLLTDVIGGGLVADVQWNAVVFADTVTVRVQDAVVVEELVGAFDVLGKTAVVGGGDVDRGDRR